MDEAGVPRESAQPVTEGFDPASALRPGRFDPVALLVLTSLRSAAPALIPIGLIYAWLASESRFRTLPEMTSPGDMARSLLSPFAIVAFAFLVRLGTNWAGLLLAYPTSHRLAGPGSGAGRIWPAAAIWRDRWLWVGALRSVRFTTSVRQLAIARSGRLGRVLNWVRIGLTVVFWVAIVAFVVVVALNPRS